MQVSSRISISILQCDGDLLDARAAFEARFQQHELLHLAGCDDALLHAAHLAAVVINDKALVAVNVRDAEADRHLFRHIGDIQALRNGVANAALALDFVEPAWGEAPFYGVTVPDGAHYSISEAYWFWYNEEDGDEMYDGDLFDDPNKLYYMGITLVPEEGYEFLANEEGDIVALINGSEALVDYAWTEDGEAYVMTIDFTVEDPGAPELIPIHEVWVDGWGTPVEDVVGVDHV